MTNLARSNGEVPVRMLVSGEPGTAKTGALVSLVDAGFKVRILDFDGNLEPIRKFANPEMLKNVDAITFEDRMRIGGGFIEAEGIPTAFKMALDAMDNWEYEEDGKKVSLGKSRTWGTDTIVVLDSLTKMGEAAFRRAQKFLNRTPSNTTQQVWQLAMSEQLKFIEKLTSASIPHHVIVLAHTRIISPKDIGKDDADVTKMLKERIADIVPTKLFPRALGYELPQTIAGEFPTHVKTENKVKGRTLRQIIRTKPDDLMDLKVPAKVPDELPNATGLLYLFNALAPQATRAVAGSRLEALLSSKQVATEE